MRCRRTTAVLSAGLFTIGQSAACSSYRPVARNDLAPGEEVRVEFSPPCPLALWPAPDSTTMDVARLAGSILTVRGDSLWLRPREVWPVRGRAIGGPFRETVALRHEPSVMVRAKQADDMATLAGRAGVGLVVAGRLVGLGSIVPET